MQCGSSSAMRCGTVEGATTKTWEVGLHRVSCRARFLSPMLAPNWEHLATSSTDHLIRPRRSPWAALREALGSLRHLVEDPSAGVTAEPVIAAVRATLPAR